MRGEVWRWVGTAVAVALLAGGAGAAIVAGLDEGNAGDESGSPAWALPQGDERFDLDPATFTTRIDNLYWPMEPGTRWTSREIDEEGNSLLVVVTVTSRTRAVANGVTARVVRDTVLDSGAVVEDTLDWYAQDAEGNIWYLGEDTAEFEDGKVTSTAGSWEAGRDGALAGVVVPADPVPGMSYREEFYRGEAEDSGAVLSVEEQVETPFGHHDGVLLTKGTNALEPRVLEYKLYAPAVGPALALDVSGGAGREELVRVDHVGAEAARAAGTVPLGSPYP